MAESPLPQVEAGAFATGTGVPFPGAARVVELDALLAELGREPPAIGLSPPVLTPQADNQLVQVRLGIASSLFAALRCRYAGAASHSLRVALSCSTWAMKLELSASERDALEVAALLHDVGYVGIPDQVLLKSSPLDADETRIVEQSRRMSVEILRSACAEPAILEIVENDGAWFDGSKGGYAVSGDSIPLGARMLAVAEAFDAMTSDQVFRRAMSHERAIQELFHWAGTQFDPALVRQFVELQTGDPTDRRREVARRWLHALDPETVNSYWELTAVPAPVAAAGTESLFAARLLDNMHDAVVFVDAAMRIQQWNHGAERLTGIAATSVCHRPWSPTLLNVHNEKGEWIGEEDCPVACALRSKVQSLRRLTIAGRAGRPVSVDTHSIPVLAGDGSALGAVLLMHDASPETSLEERCQSLHAKATRDPLTQVANRAEFDRVHEMFVHAHRERQIACSLIMCDLDLFKQVNDTYGHPAGDEVIKGLAAILQDSCRAGDLVARYGGEEFVVLCADCDNATATRRAEQVRRRFGQLSCPQLRGASVTASFGVTEVQPGDTAETMLRRADRALLLAKQKGRNAVVQLGMGADSETPPAHEGWFRRKPPEPPFALEQNLVTPVPIGVVVEKLRGFVADHRAKVLKIDGNHVELQIADQHREPLRRTADRPIGFRACLEFTEERPGQLDPAAAGPSAPSRTRIRVAISPLRTRDRRRCDLADRAREVLVSLRSYLMAAEEDPSPPQEGVLRRAVRILTPWLLKR